MSGKYDDNEVLERVIVFCKLWNGHLVDLELAIDKVYEKENSNNENYENIPGHE